MILANSFDTLGESKQAFVNRCRLDHSLFAVVGPAVVFGSS